MMISCISLIKLKYLGFIDMSELKSKDITSF